MSSSTTRRINIWINGKEVQNNISAIKNAINRLTNETAKLNVGSEEYVRNMKKIKTLQGFLSEHNQQLRSTSKSWDTIGGAVSKIKTGYFAVAAAITGAFASLKKFYDAYEEQERADKRLLFALKGNVDAFQQLKRQSDELQTSTGIPDEMINQIQMLGVESGKSTEDVLKITKAAVELSSITGNDLQTSFMQLNKTLTGQVGKILPTLSVEFKNLTKEQLMNGEAIDLVLKKYSGMAAQSATATGLLTASWNEFTESLGKSESGPFSWVLRKATELLGIFKDLNEVFFQFGGSRDAWEKQKEGVSMTAEAVSRFRAEMNEAQKDEDRWKKIKKTGLSDLDKTLTKQQAELAGIHARRKAYEGLNIKQKISIGASNEEISRLKTLEETYKISINTTRSKIAVLNELLNTDDKVAPVIKAQVGAYAKLQKEISDLEQGMRDLKAANQPIPESMIHELLSKQQQLKDVEETVKGIAAGLWKMTAKQSTGIGEITTKNKDWLTPREGEAIGAPAADKTQSEIQAEKEERLKIAQDISDASFSIMDKAMQMELDTKLANLEKLKKAELSNKNLTEEAKLAIEEKYSEKAKKIRRDAFIKEKAANIIRNIINTALAVTAALTSVPPNPVLAITAGITGAAETAIIAAQPVPEFSKGGYTDPGKSNEPAGVVHKGEYVVPSEVLQSYQGSMFVNQLERLRNGLPAIRTKDILHSMQIIPGYAQGGYTSSTTRGKGISISDRIKNNDIQMNGLLERTIKTNNMLIEILQNGIRADVSLRGAGGLYEKLKEDADLSKRASI